MTLKISDNIEIPVTGVAATAVKPGPLSPQDIPKEAPPDIANVPSKDGLPAGQFTLINKPGLLQLVGRERKGQTRDRTRDYPITCGTLCH